jgi:hypothetical protein
MPSSVFCTPGNAVGAKYEAISVLRSLAIANTASRIRSSSPRTKTCSIATCGGSGTTSTPSMGASATPISFALHERGHSRQQLVEAALGGERHRLVGGESAAVADAPDARFCDHVLGTGEHGPSEAVEVLLKRDVDGIERRGDLAQRPAVERPALPQPRAVQVDRDAVRACPLRLRDEIAPRGQLSAEVALRKLEEQSAERLRHLFEIVTRDQALEVADQPRLQAVQVRIAAFLVHVEMALRMEADGEATAPLAQNPPRDLLRIVPLGKIAAAFFPSRSATRVSRRCTLAPPP